MELQAKPVVDLGNRSAVELSSNSVRAVICENGGMVPELSAPNGAGRINAHWIPHFRSNSGVSFDPEKHDSIWPVKLLYDVAGNFPCLPNFGPPNDALDVSHPAHGVTANADWKVSGSGVIEGKAAYLKSAIVGTESKSLPLLYTKYDIIMAGQPVLYTLIAVENTGDTDLPVNAAWHNTVAPPFLAAGSILDTCARHFATAPAGGEFDDTGRLAIGVEFDDFSAAPLRNGGSVDLGVVPGMIGYSDFATGAVPVASHLGWSAVTNPILGMSYLTFFRGPAAVSSGDIGLNFNDFWMQNGGRRFPPWAAYDGGTDYTFCLGTENATGAYANGLAYSIENPTVLGRPTTVTIPSGETRRLVYGTALFSYEDNTLDRGITGVEWGRNGIVITGRSGASANVAAAEEFAKIEALVTELA